jgi:RNA polymerase sigma-70 factor (ECF subfamily)
VLDPDVVLTSDGGGIATAARRPVHGADRVARLLLGVAHRQPVRHREVTVNGQVGVATTDPDGRLLAICALTVHDGRVVRVDLVMTPAKLPRASQDETLGSEPA